MNKKHKTFDLTTYYKGIELRLLCVTTSKKKFAELSNISLSHINGYAYTYDLRYPLCNDNPDKLFAKPGLGGEGSYIFNRGEIKTFEEYKTLIDKHREVYLTYRHYLEKNNKL
jgi:hypothetical protein